MGRLTSYLVTSHNQSRHEVHLFSTGKDSSHYYSFIRQQRNFHDLTLLPNDHDAAEYIRQFHLDILIDLTGHTFQGRIQIPALRPAQVIVNYLGYAGPTGCPSFDYNFGTLSCYECTSLQILLGSYS
jgi:predicted O-linked N-acetylglucosamine transferase (SPINDLY family)